MASILRSGKFVRYFSGIARNIVFNSTGKESEASFVPHSQTLCAGLSNGFASLASVPKAQNPDQSLERSLKRLDHDVRRTGRISRRDIEEVLEEIRAHRSATSSQSLLVIRCCGNLVPEELPETRTALVQEIWKTLNGLAVPMDVSHYNALLRVYLENEHSFEPTAFLADLEAKGIEPNRVTFQRLISRYCQLGDIEGATRILEFMREKQLPINEHVFNALIMGHSQADDLESSLGIIAVMKQAGLEPTADTYTTLLCSYAKVGDLASIQSTLDACEQKDMYLLDKDLFDVIYTLATSGHAEHVPALLARLRKAAGYNQDAVNLILRLTNRGQERIAYEVLKTMPRGSRPDGQPTDTGAFFVRQLVRAGRPQESVLELCAELERSGLNGKAFVVAIEAAVTSGSVELSVPLLRHLRQAGQPIRQHYFWPLLCAQAKLAGTDAVLDVLRQMNTEFGLTVNGETVREYVIPNMAERNSEKVIALLRTAGISVSTATTAAVYDLLVKDRLREAAKLATSYSVYYQPGLYRRPLVGALAQTGDVESFVRFVRHMYDNVARLDQIRQRDGASAAVPDEEEIVAEAESDGVEIVDAARGTVKAELIGQIVVDVLGAVRKDRVQIVTAILRGFVEQGLSVSNGQAERISERLGSELTPEISELLGRLSAGDLEPIPLDRTSAKPSGFAQFSVEQLEKMIEQQDARGENSRGLKRFLLSALFKSRDLPRTEAAIARLSAEGFTISAGIYAQLIDLLTSHDQPDRAIEVLRDVRQREPDFVLDDFKVVRIVGQLVAQDRLADALQFAADNRRTTANVDAHSFNYNAQCWRALNALAEAGRADDLQRLFDALVDGKLVEPNNALLGPLVKVHLVNNDVRRAVDVFEQFCTAYKCTPWKNDLACRLIQAEDATNLQRLTDLSTAIHGEVNSLYDLVFAFVECGRIRQARKILETPGLRSRPQKINVACERYQQEGKVEPLEGLVEATKDLNHIDRGDIYYNLLLSYCKDQQPEKALGLWTKMQEEDIAPGEQFLNTLGSFLRDSNLEVPFIMPEEKTRAVRARRPKPADEKKPAVAAKKQPEPKAAKEAAAATPPKSETLSAFKRALRGVAGVIDIDACQQARKALLATDELSVTDRSVYIERLVNADRMAEANGELLAMLQRGQFPIPRIFRYYLNRVAVAGDTQVLQQIDGLIGSDTKKLVSFDNRLCHAHVESGKTEQYLRHLADRLAAAETDAEAQAVGESFPRGGAVGILEKHPELSGQFEELAEKYAARGIVAPMNVLWIHHFVAGNEDTANRLWTKHVSAAPRLMFQRIVQIAREQQNEPLVRRLLDTLKSCPVVTDGALGIVHSCLIDVQAAQGRFDDGLASVESALKDVQIDQINRTALLRIKDGLEQSGKAFPHRIPDKQPAASAGGASKDNSTSSSSSSSSDSSSSDDEPRPTKRHDEKKRK